MDVSHNGEEAFQLTTSTPYDAIVLDVMLPGRDGLSVVKALRERKVGTPCCCSRRAAK